MKITKLVLSGYKRLMLGNINEFIYTPTSPYQLILGTNGSGKSSILMELSPLPAFSGDYIKGGYKAIELEKGLDKYELVSSFKVGNKHSFLKNGEELNPGGTGQVQKELVRREFNLTPEIHEIITGNLRFTTMPPMKRRELITAMSDSDLSFAIDVYNDIKKQHNLSVGGLTHVKKRLGAETSKLLALADLDGLGERADALRRELQILMENKELNVPSQQRIIHELDSRLQEIERISKRIMMNAVDMPKGYRFDSLDSIEIRLSEMGSERALKEAMLNHYTAEYAELENLITAMQKTGVQGIDELKLKLSALERQAGAAMSRVELFKGIKDAAAIAAANELIMPLLETVLTDLPDNSDRRYSKDAMRNARDELAKLRGDHDRVSNRKSQAEQRIDHIEAARDTQCPDCGYIWKEGVSEKELDGLRNAQAQYLEILKGYDAQISSLQTYVEEADEYITTFNRYRALVNDSPRLGLLWDYFAENECFIRNPKSHVPVIYRWQQETMHVMEAENLQEEIGILRSALQTASVAGEVTGAAHFEQRVKVLNDNIEQATWDIASMRVNIDIISCYRDNIDQILYDYASLQGLLSETEKLFDVRIRSMRNELIEGVIHGHQNDLGVIQVKLAEKTTLEDIIGDLERDCKDMEIETAALKLLMDEMSPVDGLIAEQLFGFIKCFTTQLNEVIAQVWTYDLEVLSCGLESGELDYKFPLQVRSAANIVPDISKGSTAQMEIVDFAYKLVSMLYLNLADYPLFLDELGHSFDEQHRANVMNYVKLLIESKRHSQMFMISHYASSHGAMTQAEVCVLDSANISTPLTHNRHVVMR